MARSKLKLGLVAAAFMAGSAAYAQGNTSGPAAGSNVIPDAALQREWLPAQEGRSVALEAPPTLAAPVTPGAAGGMPGVAAMPGTEGGPAPAKAPSE